MRIARVQRIGLTETSQRKEENDQYENNNYAGVQAQSDRLTISLALSLRETRTHMHTAVNYENQIWAK